MVQLSGNCLRSSILLLGSEVGLIVVFLLIARDFALPALIRPFTYALISDSVL